MNPTEKCDHCHKKRKLYYFGNKVAIGYFAYCMPCATKLGYMRDPQKK